MKTLDELNPSECRWPVGEVERGEFLFCGELKAERMISALRPSPYRQAHLALAFRPRVKQPEVRSGSPRLGSRSTRITKK
ncbi:GcrA family cell cycle regulator [Methylocapsa palsarum]|uniref:GcrA family cell cycle regulator n=1 Tax=Methylocapsa palsarum TaxID=1612308 RepID=UPI001587AA59